MRYKFTMTSIDQITETASTQEIAQTETVTELPYMAGKTMNKSYLQIQKGESALGYVQRISQQAKGSSAYQLPGWNNV